MNPALTQSELPPEVCRQTSDKARSCPCCDLPALHACPASSRKLPRLFVENGMWYCFMLGDWLTGKGNTPKQAYDNWQSRGLIK